jgi:uncharacterized ferritin-like protein (DUF455 family)
MTSSPPRTPSWEPFRVTLDGNHGDLVRSLSTQEGIGDRLRSAAFAEIQAREAFIWAASTYVDADSALREAWLALSVEENKHLNWLLQRMQELGLEVGERKVSDHLWISLTRCTSAEEFTLYMASAEERGRKAGVRFYEALLTTDPITAKIFGKIAEEEVAHIALAQKFFVAR